ncbi:hypothetical protein N7492_006388 [Penicillium capsulatum]|uniref:FAD-binding FR-type domain-containing protein n=1 Tax=Penicillium capsulatum TaxID=69766 RepID=A0A9W9LL40_9EURO|nr:hypothetical protein N7492_006388 [Penicillium capsulatum]KAJ6116227.1 hypothetical protein N7512_005952 [Penicillium capsulatum]
MLLLGWLVVALGAICTQGSSLPKDERCMTAVFSAYNYISFAGVPAIGMWDTRCRNPLKVASIYAASEVYCHDHERTVGLAQLAALCEEFGHRQLLPREAVAENITEDAIRTMRTVNYLELSRAQSMNDPIMLSSSYFKRMFNTIDSWQFETWSHHAFGYIGYVYWGGILLVGMVSRLCTWVIYHRKPRVQRDREFHALPRGSTEETFPWVRGFLHSVQTHLVVPAPLATRGRNLLGCTFSTRAEALAVVGFWILSITLSVIGYRTFPGNIYWPDVLSQLLRYSADRTGIMSFANLPLLWLFGGRNNVLIWATGWSFATFNVFHRHVARVATLQGVVHSFLYLAIYIRVHKLWKEISKIYVMWGILAFFVMILLLVSSLDRVRSASYEVFLVTHIVFSVLCLVGCFYHTVVFEGHQYWQYLWPSVAVWVIDRVLRVIRLCYCNIHVGFTNRHLDRASSSRMSYDAAADVVRLEVMPGRISLPPAPGDYYFLYQPFRWTGWENHPFTVGAFSYTVGCCKSPSAVVGSKPDDGVDVSQLPLLSEQEGDRRPRAEEGLNDAGNPRLTLTFWIRPYDGWTRQLRDQCLRSANHSVTTTILLEGPYGHHFPLWKYESVLMVVGGTGVASAVPYIQDHVRRSMDECDEPLVEKTRTREIELVWTARQAAFLREVACGELKPALCRADIQASFYTTGPSDLVPEDLHGLGSEVQRGRPRLQSLIMSRASDAASAGSRLAILVCGPAGMADEARAATHLAMRQGYRSIQYVEESFAW